MADLKISQLTGATTPLAGTEAVPLVQSGTTKKVAVSDLTAGRTVQSAESLVGATSICAQIANTNYYSSIAVSPSLGRASVVSPTSDSGYVGWLFSTLDTFSRSTQKPSDAALYADRLKINGFTGDVSVLTGNVIQGTAAKGYNFTANTPAAGMTSQLLNWYEEGTWTPVPTASSGTITSYTSSGRYTRTGRSVVLSFQITITNNGTGAGILLVTGVPFAASAVNREAGAIAEVAAVGFSGYTVFNTTTRLSIGKYDNTYPGGTNNVIVGQITYQV